MTFLFLLGALFLNQYLGSDIETDAKVKNALFDACLSANTVRLEKMFSESMPPNFDDPIDESNTSPLQILVEKASDYAGTDPERTTKLVELINLLVVNGANLKRVTDSGWTALTKAVYFASENPAYPLEIITSLLPLRCPAINIATRSRTPLHFAAASKLPGGRALEIVRILVDRCSASINYNARDSKNWTPLKTAINAENNNIKDLLKAKTPYFTRIRLVMILFITVALLIIVAFVYFNMKSKNKKEKNEDADNNSDKESDNESDSSLTERKIHEVSEDDE